ncbi:hypothetical protein BH23CHL1_BH23CHL1_05190 [soil metagenome]
MLNRSTRMTANAFASGVIEKIGFYVYLLIDPRDGVVFYVGKGTGIRCFAHLEEARRSKADTVGDYAKLARIREIELGGASVRMELLRHGLSEREAFLVESAAIDLLGLQSLMNRVVGHDTAEYGRMSIMDINALYGATPVEINPNHRVVLIRINRLFERGMSDEELYEATRKWWRVGHRRRQLETAWAPEWAMTVFSGVVRAVYRIEAWEEPTDEDIDADPTRANRWVFQGTRDLDLEMIYLYRDVSSYLRAADTGQASQNPMRYVNCARVQQEPL